MWKLQNLLGFWVCRWCRHVNATSSGCDWACRPFLSVEHIAMATRSLHVAMYSWEKDACPVLGYFVLFLCLLKCISPSCSMMLPLPCFTVGALTVIMTRWFQSHRNTERVPLETVIWLFLCCFGAESFPHVLCFISWFQPASSWGILLFLRGSLSHLSNELSLLIWSWWLNSKWAKTFPPLHCLSPCKLIPVVSTGFHLRFSCQVLVLRVALALFEQHHPVMKAGLLHIWLCVSKPMSKHWR